MLKIFLRAFFTLYSWVIPKTWMPPYIRLPSVYKKALIRPEGTWPYESPTIQVIVELEIPEGAERYQGSYKRYELKCRADMAYVKSITYFDGTGVPDTEVVTSFMDNEFRYIKGSVVYPKYGFSDSYYGACASGIHFFMTRKQAERY